MEDALGRHVHGAPLGLDAGAAAGAFTRHLARHVERAVGLEIAFDRARRARQAALRDLYLVRAIVARKRDGE